MKEVIAWILLGFAGIGGLYAIALIISYIIMPKDLNDVYDYCRCKECNR
jgi:hypothetical protein